VSLTVCGVEFDEAVLSIEGLGDYKATVAEAYDKACSIISLDISVSSY